MTRAAEAAARPGDWARDLARTLAVVSAGGRAQAETTRAEEAELAAVVEREAADWLTRFGTAVRAAAVAFNDTLNSNALQVRQQDVATVCLATQRGDYFTAMFEPGGIDERTTIQAGPRTPGVRIATTTPRGRDERPYDFTTDPRGHLALSLEGEPRTPEAAAKALLAPWLKAVANH